MTAPFSKFTNLRVKLDVKLKTDEGMGTVTNASTGLVVTFNKTFADIRKINVTAAFDNTNGPLALYDFVDAPNPTQMTVHILATKGASAGNKITGSFSWDVKGV